MYSNFKFEVLSEAKLSDARTGLISTPHGDIQTPAFIFCGTKGVMKGCTMEQMVENNTQIILSNTYHLFIYPGSKNIKKMGGLHKCTGWTGPILTDSGGYQIFAMGCGSVSSEIKGNKSKSKNNNMSSSWKPTLLWIKEEGACFESYNDRSKKILTPELSMEIQRDLGADLVVVFDECTPYNVDKTYTENSMRRSHRWALRCLDEFKKNNDYTQALYGIVQGSIYKYLREESSNFCNDNDFFGIAIGGSLGDSKEMMYRTVQMTMKMIRKDRPVHLLGIGGIKDIFNGVRCGIDTFDCVHPTRIARHGCALVRPKYQDTSKEHIDLSKGRFKADLRVIEEECKCSTCKEGKGYSRMYLNYLIKINESASGTLITNHNVYFMNNLMVCIREAITTDTLDDEEKKWIT